MRLYAVIALLAIACGKKSGDGDASAEASVASLDIPSLRGKDLTILPPPDGRAMASGFATATAWINTSAPLTLEQLKGKVVVVDFWTSCCINCLHTLPRLAALEKTFADAPLVVLGVHSPKFDAESERERLEHIIMEQQITHAIAVDGSTKLWDSWKATSWPTIYVLDADGKIVWRKAGEPDPKELESMVASALDEANRAHKLDPKPLTVLKPIARGATAISSPGKVIALKAGGFAFSDTAHNRIVFVSDTGTTDATVGSNLAGFTDGTYGEASFRKPQGLAEQGDIVYVADTENHAVRAIDRKAKTVTTVAGNGQLGNQKLKGEVDPKAFALRSPWDLLVVGDRLFVALAGSHQIATLDRGKLTLFAGDGNELRKDGKGADASFAQPSGLATDGKKLFVADSETSSVRAVDLGTADVRTIVGKDLFVFGDVDGAADAVRLKHPVGITYGRGAIWLADTYNSKVKRIDPATGQTTTFAGASDRKDLFEPQGIFFRKSDLLIADTGHDRIVSLDIAHPTANPIAIMGLSVPTTGVTVGKADAIQGHPRDKFDVGELAVPMGKSTVHMTWSLPTGTGINDDAPFVVRWTSSDGLVAAPLDIRGVGKNFAGGFDTTLEPMADASAAKLTGDVDVVVCDTATHAVCVPLRRRLELTLQVQKAAVPGTVKLSLPAAKP